MRFLQVTQHADDLDRAVACYETLLSPTHLTESEPDGVVNCVE